MYRFIMSDLLDCWKASAPLTLARKSGWTDYPEVKSTPNIQAILRAKDTGVFLPRTPVWSELADAMHRATQKVTLATGDIEPERVCAIASVCSCGASPSSCPR